MAQTEPTPPATVHDPAITPLDRWIRRFGHLLSLLFLLSGGVIVFEVVARYLFNAPTIWGHETTMFLCGVLFAYGGSYCLAGNGHIRIVLIYDRVSNRVRRRLDIAISAVGVLYGVMLSWAAWTVAERALFAPWGAFRMETSGSAWNPPFPALLKTILMLVLILMTVQYVLHLIHHIRRNPDV